MRWEYRVIGVVAAVVGAVAYLRSLLKNPDLVTDATNLATETKEALDEFFAGVAWQAFVSPGLNEDAVDYWKAHHLTAEEMAAAVEAHTVLPLVGELTFSRGYWLLNRMYYSTTVRDVTGGYLIDLLQLWKGDQSGEKIMERLQYVQARAWAVEQLEVYVSYGAHFGYGSPGPETGGEKAS